VAVDIPSSFSLHAPLLPFCVLKKSSSTVKKEEEEEKIAGFRYIRDGIANMEEEKRGTRATTARNHVVCSPFF